MPSITINQRIVGAGFPVYFIADIASNHSGSLSKARELIYAGAESGVHAIKMQNFTAETIVSDLGFKSLKGLHTHQSNWKTSVFESYKSASIPIEWTHELAELSEKLGMDYLTSPYSLELIHAVAPHVCAFKLGSGDLTWHEAIQAMASHNKPLIIATGASTMQDVEAAMRVALAASNQILLMQCNTEYTAKPNEDRVSQLNRFRHINLRVIDSFAQRWPSVPIGLSDHTKGDTTVLGAVGLFGCTAVEKHFTLDNTLEGQDHSFSMTPADWHRMVTRTDELTTRLSQELPLSYARRLELVLSMCDDPEALDLAVGDGIKRLEENEFATTVVQRRSVRAAQALPAGRGIEPENLCMLRPCPEDALPPYRAKELLGRVLARPISAGENIRLVDLQ